MQLPPAGSERAVRILERDDRRVAALIHDAALADAPALLDSVAVTAGISLENERLRAELRAQLAEVRTSRTRLLETADTERRRLERNLHDGAQQRLLGRGLALKLPSRDSTAPIRKSANCSPRPTTSYAQPSKSYASLLAASIPQS